MLEKMLGQAGYHPGTEAWELFSGFAIFSDNFALPQLCLPCLEKALKAGLGLLFFPFD